MRVLHKAGRQGVKRDFKVSVSSGGTLMTIRVIRTATVVGDVHNSEEAEFSIVELEVL